MGILSILDLHISTNIQRPPGLKDKASDFESEDWGFESLCGRLFIFEQVISDYAQQIKTS